MKLLALAGDVMPRVAPSRVARISMSEHRVHVFPNQPTCITYHMWCIGYQQQHKRHENRTSHRTHEKTAATNYIGVITWENAVNSPKGDMTCQVSNWQQSVERRRDPVVPYDPGPSFARLVGAAGLSERTTQ